MTLYRVKAALPTGDLVFLVYEEEDAVSVEEQVDRIAALVPDAQWDARPLGDDEDSREVLRND